jgi:hypothetical protein
MYHLPCGFSIEYDVAYDGYILHHNTNIYYRLQHPNGFRWLEDWINHVERIANVAPGTFHHALGVFYGQHRQASQTIYGNTASGPYQSPGGAYGYAQQAAYSQAQQLANYSAAQAYANAQSQLSQLNAMGMYGTVPQSALGSGPSAPPHAPTTFKFEGIRAGEIIAWRGWVISGDELVSIVASARWISTGPMTGDPAAGYGIHAYKGPHGVLLDGYVQKGMGQWVIGEVALWGDVIEHEDGYRAEFARVHSLVTWSDSVSPHLRQVITEKYITSQPVYKIDDAAEGEDDGMPLLPRSHRKET